MLSKSSLLAWKIQLSHVFEGASRGKSDISSRGSSCGKGGDTVGEMRATAVPPFLHGLESPSVRRTVTYCAALSTMTIVFRRISVLHFVSVPAVLLLVSSSYLRGRDHSKLRPASLPAVRFVSRSLVGIRSRTLRPAGHHEDTQRGRRCCRVDNNDDGRSMPHVVVDCAGYRGSRMGSGHTVDLCVAERCTPSVLQPQHKHHPSRRDLGQAFRRPPRPPADQQVLLQLHGERRRL